MTTTHAESPAADGATLGERAADALRTAAHVSHEARLLQSLADDAVEGGLSAARRTITHGRRAALDARDELTYRVNRQPGEAMVVMFGVGALIGLALGMACRRVQTWMATSRESTM